MHESFIILLDKEYITINSDIVAADVKIKIIENNSDEVLFDIEYSNTHYIRFKHGLESGRYIIILESSNSKITKRVTI